MGGVGAEVAGDFVKSLIGTRTRTPTPRVPFTGTPTMDEWVPEDEPSMVGVSFTGTLARGQEARWLSLIA